MITTQQCEILDNNGKGTSIKIPPGIKQLRIVKITVPEIDFAYTRSLGKLHYWPGEERTRLEIELDESICENIEEKLHYKIEKSLSIKNERSFKFRHMEKHGFEGRIILHYQLLEIEQLEIIKPEKDFEIHLENYDNSKIVFSAPFGDGKTTFLNYFFETRKEEYEVFNVFPVNYSVASNEDIFKYIKADILFQLLNNGVEFDQEKFSSKLVLESYISFNVDKIILSFLQKLSALGPDKYMGLLGPKVILLKSIIGKMITLGKEQRDECDKFKEKIEVDDKQTAEEYIKEIYEKEGSLFEDNFFTQLIRQLIERITEESNKKTVLIIEDLDRMDPDHIFRILNVISAHYDTYKHFANSESHNKFGFDKIIVVCDVKNIRSIFEHRYGSNVHFEGYFNKFFSTKPFEYDNKRAMKDFVALALHKPDSNNKYNSSLSFLIELFVESDMITLRDIIRIQNFSFDEFRKVKRSISSTSSNYYELRKNVMFYALTYLNENLFKDVLGKLHSLKSKSFSNDNRFNEFAKDVIAGLAKPKKNPTTEFMFKEVLYSFHVQQDFLHEYYFTKEVIYIEIVNAEVYTGHEKTEIKEANFSSIDFFDLLILTAKEVLPVTR